MSRNIANNKITVLSNGNIGIGTTNPSNSFVVAGDMEVHGDISAGGLFSGTPYTTTMDSTTKTGFISWLSSIKDDSIANWWGSSSTLLLNVNTDTVNYAPYIEYLFGSLGDTGTNGITLTLAGTNAATKFSLEKGATPGSFLTLDGLGVVTIVYAGAAITTTTAESIASGTGGSGLTISFDLQWVTVGTGALYYCIGIGQALQIATAATTTANTVATGIAIIRGTGTAATLAYTTAAGAWVSSGNLFETAADFYSLLWRRIDIVISPLSILSPQLYVDGTFVKNVTMAATGGGFATASFNLAASSATKTHFAVEGSDVFNVANFRLWKRPLSAAELLNNYKASPQQSISSYIPTLSTYEGSVLLQNGNVLFIPNGAGTVYMYNLSSNTYTVGPNATGYSGGVLLPDGRVVMIPDTATTIALYNPYTDIITTSSSATGYSGGVLLPNGNVLLVPNSAASVAIYNPYTPAITTSSSATGYSGGVLLPNGNVLLVPKSATSLIIYNYITPSTTLISSVTGYSGGVVLSDGRAILIPNTASTIKIFDSFDNSLIDSLGATGYDGGVLLPDGRVMLVPHRHDSIGYFNPTIATPTLTETTIGGALDANNIYTTAVGAYALKRLFKEYSDATIRLRRTTPTTESIDVWFSDVGQVIKYQIVGGSTVVTNSLFSWMSGTVTISTWYDQSVKNIDLVQGSTAAQPEFKYDKLLNGYYVYFNNTGILASSTNSFASSTVTNMQCIARLRDISSSTTARTVISYNGSVTTGSTTNIDVIVYTGANPLYTNLNTWSWNAGDILTTAVGNSVTSAANITRLEGIVQLSASKSSTDNKNILNIDSYEAFKLYSPITAATVSGGLRIGLNYRGFFQFLITLSTKTTDANTQSIFEKLKENNNHYNGGTLIPDGRVLLTPSGANNIGIVSGFPSVPVERCLHPCFNKF